MELRELTYMAVGLRLLAALVLGGIIGLVMMLLLAILGAEHLLTPGNVLLYQMIWLIPGLLITEWTRVV